MDQKKDENVVFDTTQQQQPDTAASEPSDAAVAPPQDVQTAAEAGAVDAPPAEAAIADDGTVSAEGEVASATETGDDAPPPEEPPPQTPLGGIAGLLGGGLKKKILIGIGILLLLIIAIMIFIPRKSTPQKVTLTWWGLWEDGSTMQGIISDFQRANPNITIEYVKQTPQQYSTRLATRIKNGTGPDIFRYHNSWVPMLTQASLLLPLPSDVITPAEFKKNYYPVMQKDLVTTGGIYGLPLGADTLALFVNTELLQAQGLEVPKNWDDFLKASKDLTVRDPASGKIKTAGTALGTYGNITHASDIMALLFAQQGVGEPGATTRNQMDALTFYTSFAAPNKGVWDETLDESVLAFSRGNLAMYFGYSWDIFTINKLNEKLVFTVHPVPGLPGKNKTVASYWVEGISSNSKHKKEAFLFMNYLAKKETQQKLFADQSKVRAFGEPYARVDLAESLKDNALVYPFVSQLPIASSTYFSSNTHDGDTGMNALMNTYLENAINGMLNDNISAKSSVETLNKGVAKTLKQYGIQAVPIKSE